jgi:phospholipase C
MADIKHVFVLAMENRSFDHIFGFSGLEGVDAATGKATKAEDLIGKTFENNSSDGRHRFAAKPGGTFTIRAPAGEKKFSGDPSHEFLDVLRQISGPGRVPRDGKLPKGEYPPVDMSGFVADYEIAQPPFSPQIVMDSQDSNNLPILNQLAAEFMVCDHWFAALPGPTWPNRFFIHAASATGETDSASGGRIAEAWIGLDKYTFHHGTIYDALAKKKHSHQIYIENTFSQVVCIGNQHVDMNHKSLESFEKDISDPKFPHSYVFIEPNSGQSESIGPLIKLGGGTENDMHPPSDIRTGEALIKRVYEGLRNSPVWDTSVLVVMFDEHGGFFDHVPPPKVRPLDDGSIDHKHGFRYDQLGVRVPALIISPWVKRNSIDHTVYEHSSLIASVVRLFGLEHLTSRDREAADFLSRLSEKEPRKDAPARLHSTLDDAKVTKVGLPSSLTQGQTTETTITYTNTGATVWSKERGYKLVDVQPASRLQQQTGRSLQFPWAAPKEEFRDGSGHDATVTPASIELPHDVRPGESVTFTTKITAPANERGCFVFQWSMTREGVHRFGQPTNPGAVFFGTNEPQLEGAQLLFNQGPHGRDKDTVVEAILLDEFTGPVASWKFDGPAFEANSATNWVQMSPNGKFGAFAECQPRYMSIRITPKGQEAWIFVMYLMLNWTGGCSLSMWDVILSDNPDERERNLPMGTPPVRIAFTAPFEKGTKVQTGTKLIAEASLSAQFAGIEFAMEYVTVAGKRELFVIGTGERGPDDTFELVWDMSKKMPTDRNHNVPDVTLVATAVATPGSKLWVGRATPRALLPVLLS